MTVNGEQLQFRVAAVARRFPGIPQNVSSDFLVADRPALESALNTSTPGSGFATELWLDTQSSRRAAVEARLRKPPFTAPAVSSRSQLEHSLRAEPIARAAVAMLETAALTAIVLALLGLVLGAVSERRDEAAELFDLEAQGVAPRACGASSACEPRSPGWPARSAASSPGCCSRCSSFASSSCRRTRPRPSRRCSSRPTGR